MKFKHTLLIFFLFIYCNNHSQVVNREDTFDVLPGFQNPPDGYGEVPFYWWMGDTLTRERLLWQLEKLSCKGITSLQVNYAHSDKGGIKWGLSYPSKPALFSREWWDLFGWFMKEAANRGMAVSLSDYTLGLGQGSYVDEIINEDPSLMGYELFYEEKSAEEFSSFFWDIPNNWISIKAYQLKDNKIVPGSGMDLQKHMSGRYLTWTVPAGQWLVTCVYSIRKEFSLDPMNYSSGNSYIKKFFQRFEDRFPGESGKGLNFFFSDELDFNLYGKIWNKNFEKEFLNRKGYSIIPELVALFTDIGPATPKIRLDYNDVMVSLSEEGFFKPIFEWQQERGMIYGCDHGGRGKDVLEFGDYFRTQRWNQGPGCDQPMLSQDVVKNKVASSIAHLYQRPRTWLEGFHSSGWSTSSAQLSEAIFSNYVMGQNLLSLHGLYYSTHGGYWEWAPPCNHFRMPYYEHIKPLMKCVERLSYILSQGTHLCDVAILYPVEPAAVKSDENTSVKTAFETGTYLYNKGIDFDFMDYESAARSEISGSNLMVSGEKYKVLIIPSMKAIRFSTVKKALEFFQSGGVVINIGYLPSASERIGSNDSELNYMIKELFGTDPSDTVTFGKIITNSNNGKAVRLKSYEETEQFITSSLIKDFEIRQKSDSIIPRVQHRVIGNRDIYAVYNIPKGTLCFFRSKGKTELWDPFTGEVKDLIPAAEANEGTVIVLPGEKTELQLIVFNRNQQQFPAAPVEDINISQLPLNDEWQFEIKPVLDNTWGDYHWPPTNELIGPEIHRLKYSEQTYTSWEKADYDDSGWEIVSNGYGPAFYKIGPLPEINVEETGNMILRNDLQFGDCIKLNGSYYNVEPYYFSWKRGVENDPGHQGWHGLKVQMYDEFIRLGKPKQEWTNIAYIKEEAGRNYFLYTFVNAPSNGQYEIQSGEMKASAAWINGQRINLNENFIFLKQGSNSLLLHYDQPGTTYFILKKPGDHRNLSLTGEGSLAMKWYGDSSILRFDIHPEEKKPAEYFRFKSAPGLKGLQFAAHGKIKLWINGREYFPMKNGKREDGSEYFSLTFKETFEDPVSVALQIEPINGFYAGAALPEPIKMTCGNGKSRTGDWSQNEGLYSYSGGVIYTQSINLSTNQTKSNLILDLSKVNSSAEVFVNEKSAGVRLFPPYRFNVTAMFKKGENKISVLVYNTAANHYTSIPTRYRGSLESGLLGPVVLEIREK